MKFFKQSEFECKCGKCGLGFESMKNPALIRLEKARDIAKIPFVLNCAVRCPEHNKAVGGKPNSAHLRGYALDVRATTSQQRFKIVDAAIKAGFNRIGVYKTFVHMDCDPSLPSHVMWYG